MRIGHTLRCERKAKGWSQEALSQLVGMSQSNLSNIESNKQDVRWEQIEKFSQVLSIPTDHLTNPDNVVLNIENQHGSNANIYNINKGNESEIAALKNHIRFLESEIIFLR